MMCHFRLVTISLFLLAAACAGTSATPLPATARSEGVLFYVENHGNDERHLEQIILKTLLERGLSTEGGTGETRPEKSTFS
jgi:hypothetical protein